MGPYPHFNDPTTPKSHPTPFRNPPELSTDGIVRGQDGFIKVTCEELRDRLQSGERHRMLTKAAAVEGRVREAVISAIGDEAAVRTINCLQNQDWQVESAHH